MSENDSTRRRALSRRSVLRKGTLLASVGAVGLPAATGPAAATNDCPRSPGYWKTHWAQDYLGDTVDVPPAGTMTKSEIRAVLTARPAGDTVTIMAKQYIATYLNLLQRAGEDLQCSGYPVAVDGIGTVLWSNVKNSAQAWLRLNGWEGQPYSGSRTWSPSVDVFGIEGTVDGEALKDALAAFNNAEFEELSCDCDGDEERDFTEESGDADTSLYPPELEQYHPEPTGTTTGRVNARVGFGRIRKYLEWLR